MGNNSTHSKDMRYVERRARVARAYWWRAVHRDEYAYAASGSIAVRVPRVKENHAPPNTDTVDKNLFAIAKLIFIFNGGAGLIMSCRY